MKSAVQVRPVVDVPQQRQCSFTPLDVKRCIDKRRDIEQAWRDRMAELTTVKTEDPVIEPLPQKQHKRRKSLSDEQIDMLRAGTIPPGVNWSEMKLTRSQRADLRDARRRLAKHKARRTTAFNLQRISVDVMDSVLMG